MRRGHENVQILFQFLSFWFCTKRWLSYRNKDVPWKSSYCASNNRYSGWPKYVYPFLIFLNQVPKKLKRNVFHFFLFLTRQLFFFHFLMAEVIAGLTYFRVYKRKWMETKSGKCVTAFSSSFSPAFDDWMLQFSAVRVPKHLVNIVFKYRKFNEMQIRTRCLETMR